VLDDVPGVDFIKRPVRKRIGNDVQIVDDIHAGQSHLV
jgi:hypothetical protein